MSEFIYGLDLRFYLLTPKSVKELYVQTELELMFLFSDFPGDMAIKPRKKKQKEKKEK